MLLYILTLIILLCLMPGEVIFYTLSNARWIYLSEREREREGWHSIGQSDYICLVKSFHFIILYTWKYEENFDFSSRNSVYIPPSLEFPRNSLPDTPLKCRSQVVSALKGWKLKFNVPQTLRAQNKCNLPFNPLSGITLHWTSEIVWH